MGLCFAFAAPTETEANQVRWTIRNSVVGGLALAAFAVVALLPHETVLLLSYFSPDQAELVIAVSAAVAVGLPLALKESPTLQDRPNRPLLTTRNMLLATSGLVTLALAHNTGSTYIALLVIALGFPLPMGAFRIWRRSRRQVEPVLWRQPFSPQARPYRIQALNHWLLLALAAAAVPTGAFEVLRVDLLGPGYDLLLAAYFTGLALLALLVTVPLRRLRWATNLLVAIASAFLGGQLLAVYGPPANPVTISSPVGGEWYVVHGGRSEIVNGHKTAVAQDFALDIVQVVDGSSHLGDVADLSSYYAWNEPVRAPRDGVITSVIDEFPDQDIGSVDREHPAGNQVTLQIGDEPYLAFGHLRSGSIRVSTGDRVRQGDLIGLVGNSGNSDEPHLHLQAQNNSIFDVNQPPEHLVNYPLLFDDVSIQRAGIWRRPALADLRRGDVMQPVS